MANVFNAHQIAAFGHYQQISSTHAIGHRNQIAAFEYCRDVANIPVALLNAAIPNIQNQQTNLANQLQNHQRREQVPGRATHKNIEERKVSLEMDLFPNERGESIFKDISNGSSTQPPVCAVVWCFTRQSGEP